MKLSCKKILFPLGFWSIGITALLPYLLVFTSFAMPGHRIDNSKWLKWTIDLQCWLEAKYRNLMTLLSRQRKTIRNYHRLKIYSIVVCYEIIRIYFQTRICFPRKYAIWNFWNSYFDPWDVLSKDLCIIAFHTISWAK